MESSQRRSAFSKHSRLYIFPRISSSLLHPPKSRQQEMAHSSTPSGSSSTVFHQHFNMHPSTFPTPSPDRSLSIPSSRVDVEIRDDKCPACTQKRQQCSRSNKSEQQTGGHQETDAEGNYTKTWEQLLEEVCGQHQAMALRNVSRSLAGNALVRRTSRHLLTRHITYRDISTLSVV